MHSLEIEDTNNRNVDSRESRSGGSSYDTLTKFLFSRNVSMLVPVFFMVPLAVFMVGSPFAVKGIISFVKNKIKRRKDKKQAEAKEKENKEKEKKEEEDRKKKVKEDRQKQINEKDNKNNDKIEQKSQNNPLNQLLGNNNKGGDSNNKNENNTDDKNAQFDLSKLFNANNDANKEPAKDDSNTNAVNKDNENNGSKPNLTNLNDNNMINNMLGKQVGG